MLLAALVINESIKEAKELNLPLFIAFLDSQKAFDVVDHQSLRERPVNLKGGGYGFW